MIRLACKTYCCHCGNVINKESAAKRLGGGAEEQSESLTQENKDKDERKLLNRGKWRKRSL